jgi:hypothetical protein
MSTIVAFIKSEPVVIWIGIVDAAIVAAVSFGLIPNLQPDQRAAIDTLLQLVLAVIVRSQTQPADPAPAPPPALACVTSCAFMRLVSSLTSTSRGA